MQRFGAVPETWDHFADKLKLEADLLPVVSNPHALISDRSMMKAIGKTPSIYNNAGKVTGIPKWTQIVATEHSIQRWKSVDDYGICIQTRAVRAFDIDVPDMDRAIAIATAIEKTIGMVLPLRSRGVSGKRLLAFRYNRPLTKRVVPVEGGMVELLGDGQQFIAAGMHPEGEPYIWAGGLPEIIPVLTNEQLEAAWDMLCSLFATGEPRIARERRAGSGADLDVHDEVADWLLENWETYDVGNAGQLFIECPFATEHTTDSGPSGTAYYPAGTGGYSQGHFVCLHAHCAGREDRDYLDATGYSLAQFADLGAEAGSVSESAGKSELVRPPSHDLDVVVPAGMAVVVEPIVYAVPATPEEAGRWPRMLRNKKNQIEASAENLTNALIHGGMCFRRIVYDAFTDELCWASIFEPFGQEKWRRFTDATMVDVRVELERRGFKPGFSKEILRECLHAAARRNTIDTAMEWLSRIAWDGTPRIERFAIDCWGWADSDYSRAVGRYVWTALAGRVIQPGVRCDMAPILVGVQGIKKTTSIQAMVPHEDMYAEIKLDDRDDDISRKLRGKLIGELEELRGLNSRALEEIKAFVSRRRESWVPKYKEFESFFWRRNLFVGTTNDTGFLADPTGERRWLPGFSEFVDVDRIIAERDQLWAEGAAEFLMEGVAWEDAERLAEIEHPRFKANDSWERAIIMWLGTEIIGGAKPMDKGYVAAGEVMSALGISTGQQNRGHELRVERALKHLGFKEIEIDEDGFKFKGFAR